MIQEIPVIGSAENPLRLPSATMVERNWSGITAYCEAEEKFSLGFVEGVNTKIRNIQAGRTASGTKSIFA